MKSVIVTGASSGIGLATAKKFHSENYFVFLLARSQTRLQEAHHLLPHSEIIACDLTDFNQIDQAIEKTSKTITDKGLNLEVLINNAGIFQRKNFVDQPIHDWMDIFRVNLMAPVYLTQKIIPYFMKQNKGSIVMVSSTLGLKTTIQTGAYSSSKASLNSLTQCLALELAEYNIRCNAIAPGIVETPIHGFDKMDSKKKLETLNLYNPLQPLGRIGTPEEIANSIFFLASDQSSWTTGAIHVVDGGINLL